MRVNRTQWPVGQGCFASGTIDSNGSAPIHYVYDCGARSVSYLTPIVERYAEAVARLDAVFISHLDGDHVDGLDILLTRLAARTVYIPYLDDDERVAALIEADAAGRLTTSLIQAQFDPAAWFGNRGVEEVIFVRGGPDRPTDGFFTPGEGSPREPPEGETCLKRPATRSSLRAAGNGSAALSQMLIGDYVSVVQTGALRWILVPYTPTVDPQKKALFRARIVQALKLAAGVEITADHVQEKLKNKDGRAELRACYDEILADGAGRNHNKVSMSLYSGPPDGSQHWHRLSRSGIGRLDWAWRAAGWIGTGDAKLKDDDQRREWATFYQRLAPMIGTMLLPHHGSKANWHRDLLKNRAIRLFVASADETDEGYKHPSTSVVLDIEDAGRDLAHVTKKPATRLTERLYLSTK